MCPCVSSFPWKCLFLHCALVFAVLRVCQCYWKTQNPRQKARLRFACKPSFTKVVYGFSFVLETLLKYLKDSEDLEVLILTGLSSDNTEGNSSCDA